MKYILIRHAQTDASRLTRALFGKDGAPINDLGKQQTKKLRDELFQRGIDVTTEPVAVSELLRAKQTAAKVGFKNITTNNLLNEINTGNPQKTLELVARAKVPQQAIDAAKAIVANPPKEKIWITHGLVIAAILEILKMTNPEKFIPDYCEIREVSL